MTAPLPAGYGVPPATRPPLSRPQRSAALLAGGIGLVLASWGFGLAFAALVGGFISAVFGLIATAVRAGDPASGFVRFVESVPLWLVVAILVGALLLGIVLVVVSVLVSRGVLRRASVHRPTAVTWSGLGIGLVAGGILVSFVSIPLSIVPDLSWQSGPVGGLIAAGVSAILGLAATAAAGAFSWWWMAHAFRAPAPAAPVQPASWSTPAA